VIVQVLGDAADAVAAHLAFGAVGVEHAHPGTRPLGWHDQDEAVGSDPEMAIAHGDRQLRGIPGRRLAERLDVYVVVAKAVHLGELHRRVVRWDLCVL